MDVIKVLNYVKKLIPNYLQVSKFKIITLFSIVDVLGKKKELF
ncbi:MAG: hypothetical protein BAJALOKI2v1_240029 [Promethearchaeota archaeon]|nr:MAG: hypothetical protein BAJALOKI2v1_240029 [Candidatus Lokiarchaeota archaeon]